MVCINTEARQFDISSMSSRRNQAGECCPYCGCNALWAKSYQAWDWPAIAPCPFCRGEAVDEHGQGKLEDGRKF